MKVERNTSHSAQTPSNNRVGRVIALLVLPSLFFHSEAAAQLESDAPEPLPTTAQVEQEPQVERVGVPQPSTMVGREASKELFETGSYIVGPGDGFMVMVGSEAPIFREVMVEGGLLIPGLPHIRVGGKTLAEARQSIAEIYDRTYKEGEIAVELSQLRQFPIHVVGAVQRPGLYVTSGVVRVSELIRQATILGASRRNIRLVKAANLDHTGREVLDRFVAGGSLTGIDSVSVRVDLDQFEATGDSRFNPFVEDGDQILVPRRGGQLRISGSVQRPGEFEFVPGDRVSDLLKLGLGTTPEFDAERVFLYRYLHSMKFMESLDVDVRGVIAGTDADRALQTGDWLVVRALDEYLEPSTINISGEVSYPGYYVIEKEKTRLRDVIEQAGGFTDDASIEAARLYRLPSSEEERDPELERVRNVPVADRNDDENQYFTMRSREIRGQMVVDFIALFVEGDENQNLLLMPGDLIVVPEQLETVKVSGQAAFPGAVVHNLDFELQDYIDQAGGFGWRASKDIRVIRARTGETKEATEVEQLEPGDRIWIKENPRHDYWEIFTQAMTVVGNVAALVIVVLAL